MKNFISPLRILLLTLLIAGFNGCISFRSDIEGAYKASAVKRSDAVPVTVYFYFSHLVQEKGFDVVPKIVEPRRGFRDIFGEAMKEISNIQSFTTFTDNDNDVDDVPRRRTRDSLKTATNFTIHITFKRENSFAKHFLADLLSYGTATLIPAGFSWDYIVTAEVSNASGKQLASYTRSASLSKWQHFLFLFVYPFYPAEVKIEEIYLESLRDIFKQVEVEGVLRK